jgi:hypothetical protein
MGDALSDWPRSGSARPWKVTKNRNPIRVERIYRGRVRASARPEPLAFHFDALQRRDVDGNSFSNPWVQVAQEREPYHAPSPVHVLFLAITAFQVFSLSAITAFPAFNWPSSPSNGLYHPAAGRGGKIRCKFRDLTGVTTRLRSP